jgi:hypothetical protein
MRDINGIHVARAFVGVRAAANKTRLSHLFYLTDLTTHKGELRLRSA